MSDKEKVVAELEKPTFEEIDMVLHDTGGNELVKQHREICQELNELYEQKNHDYGNSFGETYDKLGIISAVTRISDKLHRLESLAVKDKQMVDDERLEDTLYDLANYAIMTAMELEREEENEG